MHLEVARQAEPDPSLRAKTSKSRVDQDGPSSGFRSTLTAKAASANHGLRSHVAKRCSIKSPAALTSSVEIGYRIAAVGTETDEDDAIGPNVRPDTSQDRTFSSGSDKGHHVASEDGRVEEFAVACSGQVELGQVGYEPGGTRMVGLRSRDQLWIDIDADDDVSTRCEFSANPTRAATGVENSRAGSDHRVQQTSLTAKIHAVGGHLSEPLDIPPRMLGACMGEPARRRAHEENLDRSATPRGFAQRNWKAAAQGDMSPAKPARAWREIPVPAARSPTPADRDDQLVPSCPIALEWASDEDQRLAIASKSRAVQPATAKPRGTPATTSLM